MIPWTAAHQASLSFTISRSLHKLMSISASVAPFSSCLWSFLASGSFPGIRLLASGGLSIPGATAYMSCKNVGESPPFWHRMMRGFILLDFRKLNELIPINGWAQMLAHHKPQKHKIMTTKHVLLSCCFRDSLHLRDDALSSPASSSSSRCSFVSRASSPSHPHCSLYP